MRVGSIGRFNRRDTGRAALRAAAVVIQVGSTRKSPALRLEDPGAGKTGRSARTACGEELAREGLLEKVKTATDDPSRPDFPTPSYHSLSVPKKPKESRE